MPIIRGAVSRRHRNGFPPSGCECVARRQRRQFVHSAPGWGGEGRAHAIDSPARGRVGCEGHKPGSRLPGAEYQPDKGQDC
eukprot:scaffold4096_cov88-Isochrysis_galbana.AAC.1